MVHLSPLICGNQHQQQQHNEQHEQIAGDLSPFEQFVPQHDRIWFVQLLQRATRRMVQQQHEEEEGEEGSSGVAIANSQSAGDMPRCQAATPTIHQLLNPQNSHIILSFIFKLVEIYKLRPETKYLAMELLSQFINIHPCEILKKNKYLHKFPSRKNLDCAPEGRDAQFFWVATVLYDELVTNFGKYFIIWTLCSIQIASKLTSSKMILKTKHIQQILRKHGMQCSLTSITKFELEILRTLDFKLPRMTCFDLIGFLIEDIPCMQEDSKIEFVSRLLDYIILSELSGENVDEIMHGDSGGDSLFFRDHCSVRVGVCEHCWFHFFLSGQ
ncbi:MAG: cyclin N-terminal domain-containing protein 1, variant 2 [Marteilia pararefringens]